MKKFLIFLLTNLFLFAHPINVTQMELNLTNKTLFISYYLFNLMRGLHRPFKNKAEIYKFKKTIFNYTKNNLIFENCVLEPKKIEVINDTVLHQYFKLKCKDYDKFKIHFNLFFKNPRQIGMLKITDKNKEIAINFYFQKKDAEVTIRKKVSVLSFIKLGIFHILEGIDHITFLLMLLLPAIIFNNFIKKAIKDILIIATAFSISHSISLMLSAFGIITPPPNLIEILIAFTIFFTALNNIFHYISYKKEWLIAFLFGFIHGFAFSEAVRGLDLNFSNFVKIVLGFNIGVEIGQIIVIIAVLPILFILIKKQKKFYYLFSIAGLILSLLWMIDRIFKLNFMPF
jgi:hypothetical protein